MSENYPLCNHPTVHPDKSASFCFRPAGHEGEHQPGESDYTQEQFRAAKWGIDRLRGVDFREVRP